MKLKGFTLIEILIAMLLSGILLALAVKVVLTISSVGNLQSRTSKQNNELLSIYTIFRENFYSAQTIDIQGENNLIFKFPDKKTSIISFEPSNVIISNDLIHDTINIPWEELIITKMDSVSTLVSQVSFKINYTNLSYPILIKKEYSNQMLLKLDL